MDGLHYVLKYLKLAYTSVDLMDISDEAKYNIRIAIGKTVETAKEEDEISKNVEHT